MPSSKGVQRFCVFCGGPGITREHMWPDWLGKFCKNPGHNESHQVRTGGRYVDGKVEHEPERSEIRQGNPMNKSFPVVCEGCNGGWMKALEDTCKPILVPLIRGVPKTLAENDQRVLAAWAVKTVFMFEFSDHKTISATPDQRRILKETGEPPALSRVWIGRHIGEAWSGRFQHTALALGDPTLGDAVAKNAQTTAFACGQVFFYVATTTVDHFAQLALPDVLRPLLRQIWPFVSAPARVPSNIIRDGDAEQISVGLLAAQHVATEWFYRRRIDI